MITHATRRGFAPMSDRSSRQDLVVPQTRSSLPLVLGAVASAGIGFAAVWALRIGQAPAGPAADVADVLTPPATPASDPLAEHPQPAEPDRFAPAADPLPAQRTPPAEPAAFGHDIQRASLDAPPEVLPTGGETPRMSRFSLAEEPAAGPPTTTVSSAEPSPPIGDAEAALTRESNADDPVPPEAATDAARPATEPTTTDVEADSLEADIGSSRAAPPATAGVEVPTAGPPAETPSSNPPFSPPATLPAGDPPSAKPAPTPEPQARLSTGRNPLRDPGATLTAAVPFAAAPPIAPTGPRDLGPPSSPPSAPSNGPATDTGVSSGQGRPGPVQLEGVQAPQLTVEKRGPREVQVGKPARYEILVRNVGSATAHDVMLRDSVPYGTSLVTTTPPAGPVNPAAGGPAGDLAWMLGSLPPGGSARVSMEVMPKLEGELGSVASVTFRADASVRSRATKPDLRVEITDPKPTLIGRELKMPIKITNPGTGVATGVVLEGLLPDTLTHRAGRELEFDVGQLQPGGSRTIDLSLGSTGPGVHTVRFVARADGQIESERIVRVEITAPTLELEAQMPARRYLQRPAVCAISMANTGTAPSKSVELAAQLPTGVKFVRANNAGYYDERTHRVLWNLEELPAGERGTVELVVMPVDLGPQKIVAAARSADGLSDQIAHTIEVEGLAAVTFEVTDSEDPIEVAGLTEYVIRVGNQGTKAASGVRVSATILGEMEPVEARGPAGHRIDNLTVSFEPLARLAPTEEAVYRIRVRGHRAGDQRVQVQLTSDDHPAPITKEEITRVYADR